MKAFRISLLNILGIIDAYFLYATIGHICINLDYPKLIGESTAIFCGQLILSAIFLLCFVITTIIYVIILKRLLKMEKTK